MKATKASAKPADGAKTTRSLAAKRSSTSPDRSNARATDTQATVAAGSSTDTIVAMLRNKNATELKQWLVKRHTELDSRIAELSAALAVPSTSATSYSIYPAVDPKPVDKSQNQSHVTESKLANEVSERRNLAGVTSYAHMHSNDVKPAAHATSATAIPEDEMTPQMLSIDARQHTSGSTMAAPVMDHVSSVVTMPEPPHGDVGVAPAPSHEEPATAPHNTAVIAEPPQVVDIPPLKLFGAATHADMSLTIPISQTTTKLQIPDSALEVLKRCRSSLLTTSSEVELEENAKRVFKEFDERADGTISKRDFADALMLLGCDCTSADEETLFKAFTVQAGSTLIKSDHFISALCDPSSLQRDAGHTASEPAVTDAREPTQLPTTHSDAATAHVPATIPTQVTEQLVEKPSTAEATHVEASHKPADVSQDSVSKSEVKPEAQTDASLPSLPAPEHTDKVVQQPVIAAAQATAAPSTTEHVSTHRTTPPVDNTVVETVKDDSIGAVTAKSEDGASNASEIATVLAPVAAPTDAAKSTEAPTSATYLTEPAATAVAEHNVAVESDSDALVAASTRQTTPRKDHEATAEAGGPQPSFQHPVFQVVTTTLQVMGTQQTVTLLVPATMGAETNAFRATRADNTYIPPPVVPPPAQTTTTAVTADNLYNNAVGQGTILADRKVRSHLADLSQNLPNSIEKLRNQYARLATALESPHAPYSSVNAVVEEPMFDVSFKPTYTVTSHIPRTTIPAVPPPAPATATNEARVNDVQIQRSTAENTRYAAVIPMPDLSAVTWYNYTVGATEPQPCPSQYPQEIQQLRLAWNAIACPSKVVRVAVYKRQEENAASVPTQTKEEAPPAQAHVNAPIPEGSTTQSIPATGDDAAKSIAEVKTLPATNPNPTPAPSTPLRAPTTTHPSPIKPVLQSIELERVDMPPTPAPAVRFEASQAAQQKQQPATLTKRTDEPDLVDTLIAFVRPQTTTQTARSAAGQLDEATTASGAGKGSKSPKATAVPPKTAPTTPGQLQVEGHRITPIKATPQKPVLSDAVTTPSRRSTSQDPPQAKVATQPPPQQKSQRPSQQHQPATSQTTETPVQHHKDAAAAVDLSHTNILAQFPRVSAACVTLRNKVRDVLFDKLDAIGLGATLPAASMADSDGQPTKRYTARMESAAVEALSLAFEKFTDTKSDKLLSRKSKIPAAHTITVYDFSRALSSLGLTVNPAEVSETIAALDLEAEGRVNFNKFVKFVSMASEKPGVAAPPSSPGFTRSGTIAAAKDAFKAAAESSPAQAASTPSKQSHNAESGAPHGSPVAKSYNPWDTTLDSRSAKLKPKISTPIPLNVQSAASPFWNAVNALEAALMQEVRKRATIQATVKDPTDSFDISSRYGVLTTNPVPGAFVLRRAFAFFDRQNRKFFDLDDLHASLAQLNIVDPPLRSSSIFESSHPVELDGPLSPTDRIVPEVLSPTRIDANKMHRGEQTSHALETQLSLAARTLVKAVYRRMHGEGDPGIATAGAAVDVPVECFDDENAILQKPVTYNVFSRWALPLNARLRKVRETMQESFRITATLGGGAKDFVRAFKRISGGRRIDEPLGIEEIRSVLGLAGKPLSDDEIQCLIDYYDENGNGQIDMLELFSSTIKGWDIKSIMAAALEDNEHGREDDG